MVLKLTKKPENKRTGMAVTGPTKVATWKRGERVSKGDHSSTHPLMAPMRSHLCDNFPTCRELEAAPINSPKDWATKAVAMDKAEKSRKRLVSAGWPVIQYTMLQYTTGHTT